MEVKVDTLAADSERTMGKLEAILNWRNQANALVDGVASAGSKIPIHNPIHKICGLPRLEWS
jgi:hypothetical protein